MYFLHVLLKASVTRRCTLEPSCPRSLGIFQLPTSILMLTVVFARAVEWLPVVLPGVCRVHGGKEAVENRICSYRGSFEFHFCFQQ